MNQLTPLSLFNFVIQLGNPSDSGVNYVQSVVRYSKGSAVIATMNMANPAGQRFTGSFTVPADMSGQGYYIDITSTVYTDSGYSSPNTSYDIITSQFFVLQPITQSAIGGNTGGYVEFEEISRRIAKMEAAISEYIARPAKKQDLSQILARLDELADTLPDSVDLSPLARAIEDAHASVKGIRIPEPDEVDLYPVLEGMQNLVGAHMGLEKRLAARQDKHEENVKKMLGEHAKTLKTALDGMPDSIQSSVKSLKANDVLRIRLSSPEDSAASKKK